MAVDESTSTLWQVAGGGHTDYAGNEVEKIALNVTSPAWAQVLAPTTNANLLDADYYSDGKPAAVHHYYGIGWNSADSRIMLVGGSRWNSGAISAKTNSFNIGGGTYSASGTHTDLPASVNVQEERSQGRDSRNDNIYVFANFNVAKWTRSTNTWSSPISGQTAPFFQRAGCAFDSSRNRFFLLNESARNNFQTYDPDGNSFSTQTLTGTSLAATDRRSLVYVSAIDAFLVREAGAGGTVYKIDAATNVVSDFGATGGGSIPATTNGPNNKFLYVPALQGCVYVPEYTGNVWFLRVH